MIKKELELKARLKEGKELIMQSSEKMKETKEKIREKINDLSKHTLHKNKEVERESGLQEAKSN